MTNPYEPPAETDVAEAETPTGASRLNSWALFAGIVVFLTVLPIGGGPAAYLVMTGTIILIQLVVGISDRSEAAR